MPDRRSNVGKQEEREGNAMPALGDCRAEEEYEV
jgi:hypothetical protein